MLAIDMHCAACTEIPSTVSKNRLKEDAMATVTREIQLTVFQEKQNAPPTLHAIQSLYRSSNNVVLENMSFPVVELLQNV
jgi:hypothetical protein